MRYSTLLTRLVGIWVANFIVFVLDHWHPDFYALWLATFVVSSLALVLPSAPHGAARLEKK